MVKMPYGQKLCKISTSPYQSFRWKAGKAKRNDKDNDIIFVTKSKD
jgi:hypothetical protein